MRLFLAINLPPEVRQEIVAATADLRDAAPHLAWVREPLLHLTLKFLGEQPAERVDDVQAAIAGVASHHRELLITLGGIGAFPNFRRARVVWMGVTREPRLELLHHDIEMVCERLGFELEGRPFRPHLTLARARRPMDEGDARTLSRAAKQIDYQSDFIVRSIELMQSTLPEGSRPSEPAQPPNGDGETAHERGPAADERSASRYATLVSAALRSD